MSYLQPSPPYAAFADSGYKIKEAQSALLSNHEVLLHLQEQEAEYSGKLVLKSGEEEKPEGEEEPTAKENPEEEKNTGEEEKSGEVEKEDKKPAEPAVKYMPAREKPKGLKDVLQDVSHHLLHSEPPQPSKNTNPYVAALVEGLANGS